MKRTYLMPALIISLFATVFAGCLPETVLTLETYSDFHQDEDSANWTNPAVIDMGQEIRDILDDNGYSTSDIRSAHATSVNYGMTSFSGAHDWEVGGQITVTYNGTTETAIVYTSQSVQAALGKKIPAPLEQAAVVLINQALQDFLDGQNPILTFTVVNGSVVPAPSTSDRIVFDWRAWLAIQLVIDESGSSQSLFW